MDRKAIAEETVRIARQGFYKIGGRSVDISEQQKYAVEHSVLIDPIEGEKILQRVQPPVPCKNRPIIRTVAATTVNAIRELAGTGRTGIGVLNFASARNPGGGFLNGAMAQEESLAASGGLYETQLKHERYYKANRACASMMYTEHAIYSPEVPFFRDERFSLTAHPVTASVLTLPAVNYGEALRKGENAILAKKTMKNRMRRALAIFADNGNKYLALGAYGCGVFRNDPKDVARWWRELLIEEGYGGLFDEIVFAVLDNTPSALCLRAFEAEFPSGLRIRR